jgi:hypothetical protein
MLERSNPRQELRRTGRSWNCAGLGETSKSRTVSLDCLHVISLIYKIGGIAVTPDIAEIGKAKPYH